MPRKLVTLTHDMDQQVKRLARKMNASESEVVRQAVSKMVDDHKSSWSILDKGFKPLRVDGDIPADPDEDLHSDAAFTQRPARKPKTKRGSRR